MPSMTTYSPYETLAFFQSVARYGAGVSALQDVSNVLKHNEYIRDKPGFDASRLSIEALQELYRRYIDAERQQQRHGVNGTADAQERSPKRRKLSDPSDSLKDVSANDEHILKPLIERLYSKYKDDVVRDIRKDEEDFDRLQNEIKNLEVRVEAEITNQASNLARPSHTPQSEESKPGPDTRIASKPAELHQSTSRPTPVTLDHKPHLSPPTQNELSSYTGQIPQGPNVNPKAAVESAPSRSTTIPQQPNASQTSAHVLPHQSPGTFPKQLPSPSAQRPPYGAIQTQPLYPPNQVSGHMPSPGANVQQRSLVRNQQPMSQGRGSPIPYQGQHPYSPYPQYPPPTPQWHPHMSPQQYQQHAAYGPPPTYYPQPSNGRHPQTPQQIPYTPYPHTAPIHYVQQQQQQQQQQHWRGQQWHVHPASAAAATTTTTPVLRSESRLSIPGSGSSTPWKSKQKSVQARQRSISRPERESLSPVTDKEDSPIREKPAITRDLKTDAYRKGEDDIPTVPQPRRRGRPPSITPSALGQSRSHSIASRTSDFQSERHPSSRRGQTIKAEPPSTPMPIPSSDTEQKSSGRRGRPRSNTLTSQRDGTKSNAIKRKRDSMSPSTITRSPPPQSSAVLTSQPISQSYDPTLIMVSKIFAKTSQLLLNEITSHKLAGIFAKPLSERDAPGYKDLVLRPQDLKNIKAAVSKGGRAALAAIEAIDGDSNITPTRAQSALPPPSGVGPIGNGFYLVPKTADLVPPKGIVTSAQLEMELVRMFANAVMFNPLPSSERGFGRNLGLRRNGGDIDSNIDSDALTPTESENGSSSGADEGGIISDAREMFNDVVEVVAKWRELEGERMGHPAESNFSRHGSLAMPVTATENGRHASMSASSNVGEDDTAAGESEAATTPVPNTSTGPGRKRRKIVEH